MSVKSVYKRLFKTRPFRTALCFLIATYIRFVYHTSRKRMYMHDESTVYLHGKEPAIFAFWHGRMLLMPMICPTSRKMHILISTHRDGEMIALTMHLFGFGTVRGSSTRGGASGARGALGALKAGENVSVTPDGPKGPLMKVQPGLLTLAKLAGVPVIPVTYSATRNKCMRSWDRFMVALPFGSVYYAVGAPIYDASKEALEEVMTRLTEEVDQKAGVA